MVDYCTATDNPQPLGKRVESLRGRQHKTTLAAYDPKVLHIIASHDEGKFIRDQAGQAVSIALPPGLGAAASLRALERGLAVLAEKPLAENAGRAAAMARRAQGTTTAVDFELAELDSFRELKRQVGAGPVQSVRVRWRTRSYAHSRQAWSWKTDRAQHGGVMNLLGSHVFFLAEWMFGPIASIEARYSCDRTRAFAPPGADPAEDRASLAAVTRGGVSLQIDLDNAADDTAQVWEVLLPQARLVLEERGNGGALELVREAAEGRSVVAADMLQPGVDWRIEPFRRLAARFVDCAARRAPCFPGFEAGARVQRLLGVAADSAARGGETVVLDDSPA